MAITVYIPAYASVPTIRCSPPSWMALIALEEKGADYVVKELSFADREHKSPAMLKRNPRGTVPVLEDDALDGAEAIHETYALLEYIDSCVPGPPLLPGGPGARARALTRLHEAAYVKDAGMALFQHMMRGGDGDAQFRLVSRLRDELEHWERHYADASWCAGDTLSLADIVVFTYLATANTLVEGLIDDLPACQRFVEAMRSRPSVQRTWPSTWPSTGPR